VLSRPIVAIRKSVEVVGQWERKADIAYVIVAEIDIKTGDFSIRNYFSQSV
jgi:hypothetical protein